MLTQAEWSDAFNHLLRRLRELEMHDLVSEIEAAVIVRIVEDYRAAEANLFSHADLSDQSDTISRARLPSEAWQAAIAVLHAYLVEVPHIATRVSELLQRELGQIIFRPDARDEEMRAPLASFSLADLVPRGEGTEQLPRAMQALLGLSGMNSNARSNVG